MNCKSLLICLFITQAICVNANVVIKEVIGTHETCNAANGTITIILEGDTTGVLYTIDNGDTYQRSNFFDGLESGDYVLAATDGQFCTQYFTEQLTQIDLPSVNVDIACEPGVNFVNVDLTPPQGAGIPPYTYDWTGPNGSYSTEDLIAVPPGDYSVTVWDRDGCETDTSFVIPSCCYFDALFTPDTSYYDCLSEYEALSDDDFSALSSFEEKAEKLSSLVGITLEGDPCNPLEINISSKENSPSDCREQLIIEQTIDVTDNLVTRSFTKVSIVDYYLGLQIETEARDMIVDCDSDYESLFDEFIQDIGGAIYTTCDDEPSITIRPQTIDPNFDCSTGATTDVTFIIEDKCGNIDSTSAIFSVVDQEKPTIICPAEFNIVNSSAINNEVEDWLFELEVTDNCGDPQVTHDFDFTQLFSDCQGELVPIRVEAIDDCGNTEVCQTTVVIPSIDPPVLTCPDDFTVECLSSDTAPLIGNWLDSATGSDTDNPILKPTNNFDFNLIGSFNCDEEGELVTFQLENSCGSATCSASIIITDSDSPQLSCPENLEINITGDISENLIQEWLNAYTITDNCAKPTVENNYKKDFSEFICFEEIEVVFEAKDKCGNTSDCIRTLTLQRENNLTLECPDNLVIGCEGLVPDSIDYQLLRELEVKSDIPYDMEYWYEVDVYDLDCEFIYNFETEISVIDSCSNQMDCKIQLQIEPEPEVYIANVFSPSLSNQRLFTVYTNAVITEVEKFYIYDKWGELVYEAYNFEPNDESYGWDGRYNNEDDDGGVYVYYTLMKSVTGREYEYKGDVTLLR